MNPYRAKAEAARKTADSLNKPTAHDEAMREAFPLGAGYGRRGSAKRIEARIKRAVRSVEAEKRANHLEAMVDRYDRGEVTAQGRPPARVKVKQPRPTMPDAERLLVCQFPGGVSYCDRAIERSGDYKRLAFLPKKVGGGGYDPIRWDAIRIPPFLRAAIEASAQRHYQGGDI